MLRRLAPLALAGVMGLQPTGTLRGEDLMTLPRGATVRITTAATPIPITGKIHASDGRSIQIFRDGRTIRVRRDEAGWRDGDYGNRPMATSKSSRA